jgi:hypothetical protein
MNLIKEVNIKNKYNIFINKNIFLEIEDGLNFYNELIFFFIKNMDKNKIIYNIYEIKEVLLKKVKFITKDILINTYFMLVYYMDTFNSFLIYKNNKIYIYLLNIEANKLRKILKKNNVFPIYNDYLVYYNHKNIIYSYLLNNHNKININNKIGDHYPFLVCCESNNNSLVKKLITPTDI